MKNYYDLLGVDKEADEQTIKAAFRKLSLKYHPDRNPDDKIAEEKFKEINEAYQVLGDPEKRQAYDFGGANYSSGFPNTVEDIFRNMGINIDMNFTQGGPFAPRSNASSKIQVTQQATISLKDAVFGCELELKVPSYLDCKDCNGIGGEKTTCKACNGTGHTVRFLGAMQYASTCITCQGKGHVLTSTCSSCNREGFKKQTRNIKLKVPPGIHSQTTLHISNGPQDKCDVYVIIHVAKHPKFNRNGATLFSTERISCLDAITGGTIKVETIDGEVDLIIPQGTQQGQQLTIEGRGGIMSNGRANHIVNIHIDVPTDLTPAQIKKIAEIRHNKKN